MSRSLHLRKTVAVAGFAALAIVLGACSSGGEKAPESTTSTPTTQSSSAPSSSAPAPSPTEKSINPTGGNLFTPDVKAPGPQTAAPGNLPGNKPKN
jgi:hypothetical protein